MARVRGGGTGKVSSRPVLCLTQAAEGSVQSHLKHPGISSGCDRGPAEPRGETPHRSCRGSSGPSGPWRHAQTTRAGGTVYQPRTSRAPSRFSGHSPPETQAELQADPPTPPPAPGPSRRPALGQPPPGLEARLCPSCCPGSLINLNKDHGSAAASGTGRIRAEFHLVTMTDGALLPSPPAGPAHGGWSLPASITAAEGISRGAAARVGPGTAGSGRARGASPAQGVGAAGARGCAQCGHAADILSLSSVSSEGKQTCLLGTLAMNSACSCSFFATTHAHSAEQTGKSIYWLQCASLQGLGLPRAACSRGRGGGQSSGGGRARREAPHPWTEAPFPSQPSSPLSLPVPQSLLPGGLGIGHGHICAGHRAPWAPISVVSTQWTPWSAPSLAPGGGSLPALGWVQALRGALLAGAGPAEPEPLLTRPPCSVPSHVPGGWGGFSWCWARRGPRSQTQTEVLKVL